MLVSFHGQKADDSACGSSRALGEAHHEHWSCRALRARKLRTPDGLSSLSAWPVDSVYPDGMSKLFGDALFNFAVLLHKRRGEELQAEVELDEVFEALLSFGIHGDASVLEEVNVMYSMILSEVPLFWFACFLASRSRSASERERERDISINMQDSTASRS